MHKGCTRVVSKDPTLARGSLLNQWANAIPVGLVGLRIIISTPSMGTASFCTSEAYIFVIPTFGGISNVIKSPGASVSAMD